MDDKHHKSEGARTQEPVEEQRSLGQLAAQARESGVIGAAGTLGALGAKDAYGKAKGALQPKDEGSKIVLPPGADTDN